MLPQNTPNYVVNQRKTSNTNSGRGRSQSKPGFACWGEQNAKPRAPPRKKRCIAWSGPVRRQSSSPLNISRLVSGLAPSLGMRTKPTCGGTGDCGGGGGVGCLGAGRGSSSKLFSSCMPSPKRKPRNPDSALSRCHRRCGWESGQIVTPSIWSPGLLPTSDELDKRIREREEKKSGLYLQEKKQKPRDMETSTLTQPQIEVMSNAELLECLRQHGIDCGPIVRKDNFTLFHSHVHLHNVGQQNEDSCFSS